MKTTIVWFRKCLRVHDNAALLEACESSRVIPLFVLDTAPAARLGPLRKQFLLESLHDLDTSLRERGSRLFVAKGEATSVVESLLGSADSVLWEADPVEPYSLERDAAVARAAANAGVEARAVNGGHTLWDLVHVDKPPMTMPAMVALAKKRGRPPKPLDAPTVVPPPPEDVVALSEMNLPPLPENDGKAAVVGGESLGLARMREALARDDGKWAAKFEKPKTQSTTLSTTLLSPYIAFGCLSARRFYQELADAVEPHADRAVPPTSLLGQLFFREMSYTLALRHGPIFSKQANSPVCLDVPWRSDDEALLEAWREGKTGYPYIDACMRQLKQTGWLHHLARHAVSCFLTRGDLWISWERGAQVFEERLLDADWAINTFNWLGLAGVAPWSPPYFRVYSPSPNPNASSLNVNAEGEAFIRKYVPELANFPKRHLYSPWECPIGDQKKANCVIGTDYPRPIVDHKTASKANIANFKLASQKRSGAAASSPSPKKAKKNT